MKKNAAKLFIECLESHGIERIFGIPGEENLDMVETLRTSSIEFIVTRNEQSAVFMAATEGRLTGKAGVALATLGPGATNMMTGVAYAQLGGMPVLVITGQKPIKHSKQGDFQILDIVSIMKPITKYTKSIADAVRIPATVANALRIAEEEKPGAVHIELPEDIAREDASEYTPLHLEKIRRPIPDPKAIKQIINALKKSKRPMILVGAGANRKRISKFLTLFIQKYNIPFFTSQMGKGVIDERLAQYIGTAALTSGDEIHETINQADLILSIGHDTVEKPTNVITRSCKINKNNKLDCENTTKVIHINFTAAHFDRVYNPDLQIIGDIGNTLWQLCEADISGHDWNFEGIYQKSLQAAANRDSQYQIACCKEGITPAWIIHYLREQLDEDDIVTLDNGLYKVWFARNYPCYRPNTLLLDNALATMGAGYSSAITAKLLNPNKNIVCCVGDGGLMMNLGDIETAVRLKLNITILVLNDNAYGMIKRKQKNMDLESFSLDLVNPDFIKLSESFGAQGIRVTKTEEFIPALQEGLKHEGVTVVEVPIWYPEKIV